jgi:hypothetical protein
VLEADEEQAGMVAEGESAGVGKADVLGDEQPVFGFGNGADVAVGTAREILRIDVLHVVAERA